VCATAQRERERERSIFATVAHRLFHPRRIPPVDYERPSDMCTSREWPSRDRLAWLRNRISRGLITADIAASDHRPIIPRLAGKRIIASGGRGDGIFILGSRSFVAIFRAAQVRPRISARNFLPLPTSLPRRFLPLPIDVTV